MRPMPGDDALGRPRSSGTDTPSFGLAPAPPQMTYFIADESAIGSSSQPPPVSLHRPKDNRRGGPPPSEPLELPGPRGRSHHDLERDKEHPPTGRPSSSKGPGPGPLDSARHHHHHHHHHFDSLSRGVSPFPRSTDTPDLSSQPLTPVLLGASGPASALSSMSSRRNSLCLSEDLDSRPLSMHDGDAGRSSTVVVDDEGEEEQDPAGAGTGGSEEVSGSSMMDSGSAPQLIMPSIKMPSRRPFTEEGKRMGRLKVLIAGDSGVGKTSLIKAIVQSCEHIVHVDPIAPSGLMASSLTRSIPVGNRVGSGRQRGGSRRQSGVERSGTSQITEVYASTKPYPEWWSEVDDFRILRRRKSMGDAVLDRNICFVDTPGYGSGSSSMDTITPVAEYIEGHLQRINSGLLSDGDFLSLLGGEGGVQVDAVFYLVSNRLRPVDIQYLRQLNPLTNIILLLAQTDLMSPEQITSSKEQIFSQLKEAGIRLFSFCITSPSYPGTSSSDSNSHQGVYAISSIAGSDHDTMDASLLMSPDYVQPLIPTELSTLVERVFSPNGVSWLRHAVARKYVQWRKDQSPPLSSIPPPISSSSHHHHSPFNQPPPSHPFGPSSSPSSPPQTHSYALARLADHAQREERLAQVRLANWAADLQRSLAREREQYAALARGERAVWLAERLGECVREGEKGATSGLVDKCLGGVVDKEEGGECGGVLVQQRRESRRKSGGGKVGGGHGQQQYQRHCHQHHQRQRQRQDPLGLLEVADELRHKGLIALEVIGSLGVLGGLALWVTRHYLHGGWVAGEWERFWYGGR